MSKPSAEASFREDLYYRLNVVTIPVPPLREQLEDLLPLVEHFIDQYTPAGEHRPALDRRALHKLQSYRWPGNIREMENTVRRALMHARGQTVILDKDLLLPNAGEPALCCCDDLPHHEATIISTAVPPTLAWTWPWRNGLRIRCGVKLRRPTQPPGARRDEAAPGGLNPTQPEHAT